MSLPPEKILLRWMNFQLKKAGYHKTVTNFSSDIKVCSIGKSSNKGVPCSGSILFQILVKNLQYMHRTA